ncbi:MAG: hypothetical protein V5A55_07935 [Halovenus sp.]
MTNEPNPTDDSSHTDDLDTPEGVLSPADLAVDDTVEKLEPGRHVVPTGGTDDHPAGMHPRRANDGEPVNHTESASSTGERGADRTVTSADAYAAMVTIQTPDGINTTRVETDDVRELFDELLLWHVEQLAPDANPEKALSVLVQSSSLPLDQ